MPILEDTSLHQLVESANEAQPASLASARAELARLRYLAILTARWESSSDANPGNRAALREDLVQIRALYSKQIDEIAFSFGVQQAMEAQDYIERTVVVPQSARMPGSQREDDDLEF